MADEAAAAQPENTTQFALQRIYVKDLSFEAPDSAKTFGSDVNWQPKMNLDLNASHKAVDENHYEVILQLTLTAKQDDATAYIAEVHQAGIFLCRNLGEQKPQVLGSLCPSILFPYAREAIDAVVVKGSFPAVMLAPINFDALHQQAQQQAQGETADTGSTH